jgi:hypothetical protein
MKTNIPCEISPTHPPIDPNPNNPEVTATIKQVMGYWNINGSLSVSAGMRVMWKLTRLRGMPMGYVPHEVEPTDMGTQGNRKFLEKSATRLSEATSPARD